MELQEIKKLKPYPIVCLCGSTKFKSDFLSWAKKLTLQGYIVTMPMIFGHAGDTITDEQKMNLDKLHKAKIENADIVFIINTNGYIGESTRNEINFAKALNKYILYTEVPEE